MDESALDFLEEELLEEEAGEESEILDGEEDSEDGPGESDPDREDFEGEDEDDDGVPELRFGSFDREDRPSPYVRGYLKELGITFRS